jgi:hypothetical protein
VIYKRSLSKKGIYDLKDEKSKLSIRNAARTVSYILFIRYIMASFLPDYKIPQNFNDIAEHMSAEFIQEMMLGRKQMKEFNSLHGDLPTKNIHRWNYSLVYGFEFL